MFRLSIVTLASVISLGMAVLAPANAAPKTTGNKQEWIEIDTKNAAPKTTGNKQGWVPIDSKNAAPKTTGNKQGQ